MTAQLYFIHALSPLQPGTGQGVGVIDLPIAREKATGIPYLAGSSVKGVLRDRSRAISSATTVSIFGPETDQAELHAGAVQFSDASLLLLPVRSLYGTFAWVTSPYLLRRFQRDVQGLALPKALPAGVPQPASACECCTLQGSALVGADHQTVYLEDLDLATKQDDQAAGWGDLFAACLFPGDEVWGAMLKARLCIVHDDALSFLLNTATEVIARIRLDDASKTVQQGALWYEEALPTETVLFGLVVAQPPQKANITAEGALREVQSLVSGVLQFGGNATVGRGLCRMVIGSAGKKEVHDAKP